MPEIPTLRIELLKLVYRHGQTAEDAVALARGLEAYVMETGPRSKADKGKPPAS